MTMIRHISKTALLADLAECEETIERSRAQLLAGREVDKHGMLFGDRIEVSCRIIDSIEAELHRREKGR